MKSTKNNPNNLQLKLTLTMLALTVGAGFTLIKRSDLKQKPTQATSCSSEKANTVAVDSSIIHNMLACNEATTPALLQVAKNTVTIPADRKALQEHYALCLKEYEDALWHELEATGGLNRTYFSRDFEQNRYRFNNHKPVRATNLKPSTIAMIESTFEHVGLNPKRIGITTFSHGKNKAYAYIDRIHINEPELLKLPENIQRFVVAHEAMHIKHQDHLAMILISNGLNQNGKRNGKYQHLYDTYCRFVEIRADIQALLLGQDYAQGCMDYFCASATQDTHVPAKNVHPSKGTRFRASKAIFAQLEATQVTGALLA